MSEEVILVKSEDEENVPKSPVYLSETTSESSKPEAIPNRFINCING